MALKGTFDNQHRHQTKTTRTSLYKRKRGSFLKEGIKKRGYAMLLTYPLYKIYYTEITHPYWNQSNQARSCD